MTHRDDPVWYPRLLSKYPGDPEALISNRNVTSNGKDFLPDRLYVCRVDTHHRHAFASFPSHVSFGRWQERIPVDQRSFFEVAMANQLQKPHFDVDIDRATDPVAIQEVQDELISGLRHYLASLGVELDLTRLLLLTSHGATKYSTHVIVDGYATSYQEGRQIYDKVIMTVRPEWRRFIDRSVYSSRQQFRIVGSQKLGSGRIKTLQRSWLYQDQLITYAYPEPPDSDGHRAILELEASLLTITGSCLTLSLPVEITPRSHPISHDGDLDHVMNLLIGLDNLPYEPVKIVDNLIILRRTRPAYCRLCYRRHDSDNAFLSVTGDEGRVYLHCRRHEGRQYVGSLRPNKLKQQQEAQVDSFEPEPLQSNRFILPLLEVMAGTNRSNGKHPEPAHDSVPTTTPNIRKILSRLI